MELNRIYEGDCLEVMKGLPDKTVDCCITSPPYWGLRDYGVDGQLGLEKTPEEYIAKLVAVFREVRWVLKDTGTLWVVMGDSYNSQPASNGISFRRDRAQIIPKKHICSSLKPKDLVGIPWMLAFALRDDGWYLRQDIIWAKPNPMPESVKDRCTKSHEYVFLLSKKGKYYFDNEAVKEPITESSRSRLSQDVENQTGSLRVPGKTNGPMKAVINKKYSSRSSYGGGGKGFKGHSGNILADGTTYILRNKRSVWTIATQPSPIQHYAIYPEKLIEPMILAGCPKGGIILDPFMGVGTTGLVARRLHRNYIGIELSAEYVEKARKRLNGTQQILVN